MTAKTSSANPSIGVKTLNMNPGTGALKIRLSNNKKTLSTPCTKLPRAHKTREHLKQTEAGNALPLRCHGVTAALPLRCPCVTPALLVSHHCSATVLDYVSVGSVGCALVAIAGSIYWRSNGL